MRKLIIGGLAALVLSCSNGAVGKRYDECDNPGEVKEVSCGINKEGAEVYRCEDNNIWNKLSDCNGTDICRNGTALENCGAGKYKLCDNGHWTDCIPKSCSDSEILKDICGPNKRDDMVCVDGEYRCAVEDECVLGNQKKDYFGLIKKYVEPCQPGIEECKDIDGTAKYVLVQKKKLPELEYCDGKDNNCNGIVDTDWYPDLGKKCSVGAGSCENEGVYVCGDDKDSVQCNVVPKEGYAEFCDGLDNDCDGNVDNIADRVVSCGLNSRGFVKQSCTNSSWKDKGPCNDPDECLDGSSEEENCGYNGRGVQTRECVEGHWGDYGGCNDPDECLDGSERDFYTGLESTLGVGLCKSGVESCLDGSWTVTVSEVTPSTELCDNLDNDCDDSVDEGFNIGNSCVGSAGLCADHTGVIECFSESSSGCSVNPGGSGFVGHDEVIIDSSNPSVKFTYLNALDDDCNGIIDDGDFEAIVPEGEFIMGWPRGRVRHTPQHTVYLSEYFIDKFEVTNKQYAVCVAEGICSNGTSGSGENELFPVSDVTWQDAKDYCNFVGKDLPTEAQWEKAARGTDGRKFPWGNDWQSCDKLNYNDCLGRKTIVGEYPLGISPYGIFDASGNVFDIVNDFFDPNYYSSSPYKDPIGPESGDQVVLKSGSYEKDDPYFSLVYSRGRIVLDGRDVDTGFRCARKK